MYLLISEKKKEILITVIKKLNFSTFKCFIYFNIIFLKYYYINLLQFIKYIIKKFQILYNNNNNFQLQLTKCITKFY